MSEPSILLALVALALSGDLLFLAIGAGVTLHPYSKKTNLSVALTFALVHFLMASFALFIGHLFFGFIPEFARYAGLFLLVFTALKFIFETNKIKNHNRTFFVEDKRILLGVSVASSFNSLFVYLAIGLLFPAIRFSPVYIYTAVVFLSVLFGVFIGNKYRPERFGRFSKYLGGLGLLFLSIYLLIK